MNCTLVCDMYRDTLGVGGGGGGGGGGGTDDVLWSSVVSLRCQKRYREVLLPLFL